MCSQVTDVQDAENSKHRATQVHITYVVA